VSDGAYLSALDLVSALSAGTLSSEDLVTRLLDRIQRLNPSINAVISLDAEGALSRARVADVDLRRGRSWGALHGLPITIKDAFEATGLPTVCGAPSLRDYRPARNAQAVQRLVDAGAILLGKTNVPMFSLDLQTDNEVFGATHNPWRVERSPGGSSGGAAAALAAGLTPAELGTDLAGSLRLPAHFCGVCALKPSYGLIPLGGMLSGPPGRMRNPDLVVAGPMARSVADVQLLFDVLRSPRSRRRVAPRRKSPAKPWEKLRLAVWLDEDTCPVDEGVRRVLEKLVGGLAAEGVRINADARPGFDSRRYFRLFLQLMYGEMSASFPESVYRGFRTATRQIADDDWTPLTAMASGATQSHRDWLAAAEERERHRITWSEFFRDYDALITPVGPTAAPLHDRRRFEERTVILGGQTYPFMQQSFWVGLATAAYLPAATVPAGLDESGLPVGVQVIGPYLADDAVLEIARQLERITGGFRPPPDYA
jgi:amidase